MITITSKKEGFRRCGLAHSQTPITYEDDRFTTEELKTLQKEPMLVVTVSEAPKETKGSKGKNGKDKEPEGNAPGDGTTNGAEDSKNNNSPAGGNS
ncbi:hypothetical protein Despr_2435 [Desulfobulbus propionicus DSM 2032]|uniref:Mu-like prophage FluMu N-terminal domain-containing protein n=1 Tax=Desulfobulbus propionicus (strain ATCC 33891 / DSM 2032 / VKM B-1956 / 1pr3) TaxID=577650 RepID=A0A7U3YND5_DESPD|nr:HI1506-related protein [Desulfobulbus propionicus]ADW18574.1 hypothetical protein Despr_2435 [Desulfobulbus propionicus DSM 2032]